LGTGAYKRGLTGTVYRPILDAGWGIMLGLAEPAAVRSQYPDERTAKAILARAGQLRGTVVGSDIDLVPTRDVLDDVLHVFAHMGRPGLHWETLAQVLGEQHPEAYAGIGQDALSALVRDKGVPTEQVKDEHGVNRRGCKRRAVEAAVERREITDGQ
jgi:S-DNA-T family DNA segregation ATPase FtsK/SpoIIIE